MGYTGAKLKFQIIHGEVDEIKKCGRRGRRQTVLLQVGRWSLSRKAVFLGAALAICQVLDGLLTYVGISLLGVHMEGNAFLRELMHAYGQAPVLFFTKLFSLILIIILTFEAHRRKWLRPYLLFIVILYLCLAVIPWVMIITKNWT